VWLSMPYVAYESDLFAKQWKALCKKDQPLQDRLTEVVNAILKNPENFDTPLQGDRKFSVKKKAVGKHYRIIYRYCGRCAMVFRASCGFCDACAPGSEAVIFEEVFHRDDGY
jgi:mRNA-degrading endonuclease RelE of RelBE toxin-antitoxin system